MPKQEEIVPKHEFKADPTPPPKRRNLIMAAIAKIAPDSTIGKQYRAILAADKEMQGQVTRAIDHLQYGPTDDENQT